MSRLTTRYDMRPGEEEIAQLSRKVKDSNETDHSFLGQLFQSIFWDVLESCRY